MLKLITHVLVFLVGAGAGVYYGVNHPTEAQRISAIESAKIQQATDLAKQAESNAAKVKSNASTPAP